MSVKGILIIRISWLWNSEDLILKYKIPLWVSELFWLFFHLWVKIIIGEEWELHLCYNTILTSE